MKTLFYAFWVIITSSCTNNIIDQSTNNKLDSLRQAYTYDISSPQLFILTIKKTPSDKGDEICVESLELNQILKECNLSQNDLLLEQNDRLYLLTNSCLLNSLKTKAYNISRVDSIETNLIPVILDSIKSEAKLKDYTTFWKYYLKYDRYLIHALLRKNLRIYRDDESGYPIIMKEK